MISVLYALAVLLFSVNLVLGLPAAVNLVQTQVLANNLQGGLSDRQNSTPQVAGIAKITVPREKGVTAPPALSAAAALVVDADSETRLYAKDPDKKLPIASTTKIMTAWVAKNYWQADNILEVADLTGTGGSSMGLRSGEKITFRSLLYGLLLNSGNDAAFTLASNYPGGVRNFVGEMNRQAEDLGLPNTHFDNPAGFDSPNHFSTASDLAKIAQVVSEDPQLALAFSTKEATVSSVDMTILHSLKNLNRLLNLPGVLGIKTGTTPEAKESLVGLVERDGHRLITVVLGSEDRFKETEELIEWSYANFIWPQ